MFFKSQKIGGICLLISQMLERITYYSIQANFVYTLNSHPLRWSILNSMNATFLFTGFYFVATMFGGILADTVMKKSTTVITGYVLYLVFSGYIVIFSKSPFIKDMRLYEGCLKANMSKTRSIFEENCANIMIPVTLVCAIGSGLIKSVVASIGSDMAYQKWKNPSVFFNIYYWSLNFGSLIAFSGIAYMQQNFSRLYGFMVPGIILLISFGFFLLGMPYYINVKKPARSTLNLVSNIYYEAFCKKFNSRRKRNSVVIQSSSINGSQILNNNCVDENKTCKIVKRKSETVSLSQSDGSDSETPSYDASTIVETTVSTSVIPITFLDRSKIRFGGTFSEDDVEDVRKFTNLVVILIFLIPYWIIYFQMETTFLNQAFHMKIPAADKTNSIPACWLSMMDILVIMFMLPALVKFIYPYLRKRNCYPHNSLRISFGMFLGIISMGIAGILDIKVWSETGGNQNIGGTNYTHSNISVFYQLPQIMFMGLSESQAIVAGLELACTQVPNSMQGMTNGIFWFISGIGSFTSSGLLAIFEMDESYLSSAHMITKHYFFWLCIMQTVFLFLFVFCVRRNRDQIERQKSAFSVTDSS